MKSMMGLINNRILRPRYNARDAAIFYASLFNAKVLLGSATPSVESYYNAQDR